MSNGEAEAVGGPHPVKAAHLGRSLSAFLSSPVNARWGDTHTETTFNSLVNLVTTNRIHI